MKKVTHYFDYKSPYAFLAQEATFQLRKDTGIEIDWLPYTLNISQFLGVPESNLSEEKSVQVRNAHQWRRVKYIYLDCRREANRRGLMVRGPRKIFDSSIAHIGFLYAKHGGNFENFHNTLFERFWKRELDLENPIAVAELLEETDVNPAGFQDFLVGEGRSELSKIQSDAEARGVFGVPSYLVDNELFWGAERLGRVRELLT
ncbi:MAG: DsbA family protein [SAR324 cluster bacterium]|nr:DsbA family protein [SAR324 cluster bacterium]